MDTEAPDLIEEICELCFNVSLESRGLHWQLLDDLTILFLNKGYSVERECPVSHFRYNDIWGMPLRASGYIDLFAHKGCLRVAIEFDTLNALRRISIEKLLASGADIAIGIAGAKCSSPVLHKHIFSVRRAREYSKGSGQRLWIILLGKKSAEEIKLSTSHW
jgi:hypothetical protein